MPSTIVYHAPKIRCYLCGLPDIAAICHDCGRPICPSHLAKPLTGVDELLSSEFSALGLREAECNEEPMHCINCHHVVRSPRLLLLAASLLIVLVFLTPYVRHRLGTIGTLLAVAALGGAAVYDYQRRETANRVNRPPLPLLPRFNSIKIQETVKGRLTLNADGTCRSTLQPVEGNLSIQAGLSKLEQARWRSYRRKYRLTTQEEAMTHAGFAAFRGPAGFESTGEAPRLVLPLESRTSAQPFLLAEDERQSAEWHFTHRYRVAQPLMPERLPVWVVPSLIQEAGQSGLDLDVTWSESNGAEQAAPKIDKISRLELRVPVDWGRIEHVAPAGETVVEEGVDEATGEGYRAITWRKLPLKSFRAQGRHTLSVYFEDPISPEATIRGRLEVRFEKSISGLEGVEIYSPLGRKQGLDDVTKELATVVLVDFDLSLANLRHQLVRIVPDRHAPAKDQDRPSTFAFPGVPPHHETVMALTHAMSESCYVKRLVENPPRAAGEHEESRYWDLGGRCYKGVYPIDFHLILTGVVAYGPAGKPRGGTTEVKLTVQGAYANREMEEEIENVWETLSLLVHETMSSLRETGGYAEQSKLAEESAGVGSGGGFTTPEQDGQIAGLRKRQDELLEALLAGRVSEPTFLRLKDEIDRQIQRAC